MKHYSPTGRRNHGRPLKRLLDAWDRNESTSGQTPWQIYDDDVKHRTSNSHNTLCTCHISVCSPADQLDIAVILWNVSAATRLQSWLVYRLFSLLSFLLFLSPSRKILGQYIERFIAACVWNHSNSPFVLTLRSVVAVLGL
jgi:hypothetical protein